MIGHLSPRPPNARQTFLVVRSNDGRWKSCVSIWLLRKSFPPSVLKRFARFCTKGRSGFDEPRHGRNAMTRSSSLKKTDSQICKSACTKRPYGIIRRIRPVRSSATSRTGLVPYRSSEKIAGNLHAAAWCSALAGVLRCSSEKVVGLYSTSQKASGNPWSIETFAKQVSGKSKNSFDSGQLLAASQTESASILPTKQHSFDLDADERFMAQSNRMSIYSCEGICASGN